MCYSESGNSEAKELRMTNFRNNDSRRRYFVGTKGSYAYHCDYMKKKLAAEVVASNGCRTGFGCLGVEAGL